MDVKGSLIKAGKQNLMGWLSWWWTGSRKARGFRMRKGGSREVHDPPAKLINAASESRRSAPAPEGGAHPWRNICVGLWWVKREVIGFLSSPFTFICSYHSVIDHCWIGWWVTQKHRERSCIWIYMISGCCYALHRVRVCLLSFLHFSAMRFASLYRRGAYWKGSEKASASDR